MAARPPRITESTRDNTYIVIAAYYESDHIADVIAGLHSAGYENIVVVNDGSDRDTTREAQSAGATVLEHAVNRGQGAALRTGMEYALRHGAEYIVTFDADGQHQAGEVDDMITPIRHGDADITIGKRFERTAEIPFAKRVVLYGAILFQFILTGVWLSDAHNGFRAMSRDAAETLDIKQDRMGHATEIIEYIKRYDLEYKEVPVTITYDDEDGQSVWNAINIARKNLFHKFFK